MPGAWRGTLRGLNGAAPVPGTLGLRPDLGAFGPWHHPAGRCCRLGAGDAAPPRALPLLAPRTATRLGAGLGPGDAATGACRTGAFFAIGVLVGWARLRPSGGLHPSRRAPALGAALALPLLLSLALAALGPLARGPFAEWVLADSRQAASGPVAFAHGAVAGAFGQYRRGDDGGVLPHDLHRLAGPAPRLRAFTSLPQHEAEAARLETYSRGAGRPRSCRSCRPRRRPFRASWRTCSASSITTPTARPWPLLSGVADPWDRLYGRRGHSGERTDGAAARPVAGRSGDRVARPDAACGGGSIRTTANRRGRRSSLWTCSNGSIPTRAPRISPYGSTPEEAPALASPPARGFRPAGGVSAQPGADQGVFARRVFENTFLVTGRGL